MSMKSTRRTRVLAAAVLSLSLIAVACGSDNASESTSAAETTAASSETTAAVETTEAGTVCEPATGEPIKIGTTVWTLEMIALRIKLPGVKAAVEEINNCGGINGRPIEWIYCASADANDGEACARKMVDEGVVAVVADANYMADVAQAKILEDAGIADIDPFSNMPEVLNSPNTFSMCPPTPIEYAGIAAAMKAAGYTDYYYFAGAMSSAQNSVDAFEGAAAHYGGLTNVGRVDVPITAADYLPQVQTMVDAGADLNVGIIAPFMSALVLQAADQLGVQAKLGVSFGQFNASQYEEFADALEGSVFVSCTPPLSAVDNYPKVKAAYDGIAAWLENHPDDPDADVAAADQLSTLAIRGYLSVYAFAEVAKQLDTVDAASVLDALKNNTEGIDVGLDQPWITGVAGPTGFSAVNNGLLYLIQMKDGELQLLQPEPIDALESFK